MKHSNKGRLEELKGRLASRTDEKGFEDNCKALIAEIARLENLLAA